MASTSTSSVQKSFKYDVFLSFRGEDTRNTFVGHLYNALNQNGIETYKDDDKIEKGKRIDDQLIKSIEDSRFYIIVFSKNYASSSWCLDELVKIMECQKTSEHTSEQTAYPVFYDVEPTEIRKQSGAIGEAFNIHENEEAARKWRDALNEAGNLAGWELKNTFYGDESKLIQIIVDDIFEKISSNSSDVDRKLVGMETRIEDFHSSLELGADDVRLIGIWGMGGGGKTTLARSVFDRISIQFDGKAFVENVREVSKSSLYGLNKLQQQVLCSVLSKENITVSSVHEGTNMIKKITRGRKVLIVLDDVDDTEQLEALAGEPNWFKFGSRIIITTRDKQVLLAHRVKFVNCVSLLSHAEAISLFSKYALIRDIPIEGYEELSKQVVQYAGGLPLTIKVLGSLLCGQNVPQWIDTLERLKKVPLKATIEKLELSYNGLEEDYKEIFLDVACFLKGWYKEDAISSLESCGFFAEAGLRVLEQKSLITISISGHLWMHDHIEEMGKNIVRRLHPNNPSKYSRLWIQEEIEEILANELGTEEARYIKLDAEGFNTDILMKGLANLKQLRFLDMTTPPVRADDCYGSIQNFDEVSLYLPNALQFLKWRGYPFSSLPKTFQAKNLDGLEMQFSNSVQLWKDGEEKACLKLRFLKFTHSKLRTLDLSVAPNLETLILENCYNLVEVHFQVTPNLKELRIYDCNRLEKLHMPAESPKLRCLNLNDSKLRTLHLGITQNLQTLSLYDCTDMVELCMPAECPKLVKLDISNLKLRTLHLGIIPNLETLRLTDCTDMAELRMPAESPMLFYLELRKLGLRTLHLGITPNLETLSLYNCPDMVELQIHAECSKLVNLELSNLKLRTLHLGITPNLQTLRLTDCTNMAELRMPAECPMLVYLELCKLGLRTLHLGITPNLETLSLWDCTDMVELHMSAECPNLVNLDLDSLKLMALHLGITPNLERLRLYNCTDMVELQIPVECPKVINLKLINLKLMTLSLRITPNLKTLRLHDCTNMVELHMPPECPKLVKLVLDSLKLTTLHLGITPNLETLSLSNCTDMVELQAECSKLVNLQLTNLKLRTLQLGITPNLEKLSLSYCTGMVELRMPAECPKLVNLDLSNLKLRTLHLGITPNLETLSLSDCTDMVELRMPAECPKLVTLDLRYLKLTSLHLGITPKLETLSLKDCCNLAELHLPFRCLKLKNLSLNGSKLSKLHLGLTPDLEALSLAGCDSLVELHMPFECPKLKFLSLSNTKLSTLDLGLTPNLQTLDLKKCYDLVEINAPFGCLKMFRYLDLTDCGRVESFLLDQRFPLVDVDSLLGLYVTVRPLHSENNSPKSWLTSFYIQHPAVGNLEKLISVRNLEISTVTICAFQCLRKLTLKGGIPEVPEFVIQLEGLEELILLSTKIKHLPESICMLKYLKILELKSCWLLEKLPENLGQLQCLEELILTECVFLRDIPNSICEMKCLKFIHLPYCIQVAELPEEIGRLECLKELSITGTGISHLPESIFKVKGGAPVVLVVLASGRIDVTFAKKDRKIHYFSWVYLSACPGQAGGIRSYFAANHLRESNFQQNLKPVTMEEASI
ncbi:Toll/interleukin-1 receptor domain-containing protein [Tanacetum coccineum]